MSDSFWPGPARLVLAGACLLIAFTAFEVIEPLFSLGPLSFTTTETAAGLFLVTVLVWAAADRGDFMRLRSLDLAVTLFIATNVLASVFAADKAGALKFTLRLAFAGLVYLGIARLPGRERLSQIVAGAAVAATMFVVVMVGVVETYIFIRYYYAPLSAFQEGVITFGAFYNVRTASTLPFPTVLSAFLALAYPVALVVAIWCFERWRGSRRALIVTGVTLVMTLLVMLIQIHTFTRSGLMAVLFSLAGGAALAVFFRLGAPVWRFFALGAVALVALVGVLMFTSDQVGARFGLSEQENRYSAEYELVEFPGGLKPATGYKARLRFTNTSSFTWRPDGRDRVFASYRWVTYEGMELVPVDYVPTLLPRDVAGGETLEMDVDFLTPDSYGRYVLIFELFKTHVSWFSDAGTPTLNLPLEIDAAGSRMLPADVVPDLILTADPELQTVSRRDLWTAALKLWRDNPLIGVGTDQFRVRYGDYLPDARHDERLRTHNIILEALTNTGIIGLAAFVYMLLAAAWSQFAVIRDRSAAHDLRVTALALLTALAAFVLHGVFDYFLWQTGVAYLFFIILGLTAWTRREAAKD